MLKCGGMERTNEVRPIRLLLADDHTMFRQGIAVVLGEYGGMEVIGQADNDESAVEMVRRLKPDVVLMEVQKPFSKARENLRAMRETADPPPKVVIVTMIEDPHHVGELMELGVSAYVVKSASAGHLVAVVRATILDPMSENAVVGMPLALLEESANGTGGVLSARELEILLLAARGMTNRQISRSLFVAEGTVKRHLANTYKKMQVGSRSEATRKALFEEWITIQDVNEGLEESQET